MNWKRVLVSCASVTLVSCGQPGSVSPETKSQVLNGPGPDICTDLKERQQSGILGYWGVVGDILRFFACTARNDGQYCAAEIEANPTHVVRTHVRGGRTDVVISADGSALCTVISNGQRCHYIWVDVRRSRLICQRGAGVQEFPY